ncbi:MAG: RNA methyltransferase [Acidimicrobiia bacterium]|nr:RNA methyltransferase [Acidimicrobiia bacterium]
MTDITSLTNPTVKSMVRLRERRTRDASGTFLIEGATELGRAQTRSDLNIETVLIRQNSSYVARDNERVITVSDEVLDKVAMRGAGAQMVAVAHQFDIALSSLAQTTDLVLIAEAIEKPGNLGTMLRSADATGAAVIICDPLVDVFSPQVVRASLGCLFTVPIGRATRQQAIAWASGHTTVVGTPEADRSFYETDLTGPVAFVVGSEHDGVSDEWKAAATVQCSIPMAGYADSLNAATSAALMLYEAVRQRHQGDR